MNPRLWPTLGWIAVLCFAPAWAKGRKTPEVIPELGSISVKVKTIGPTVLSARPLASAVFFVRSDPDTTLLQKTEILASEFNDKNQVYLFNVPPGKYAAVGAYTEGWTGSPTTPGLPSQSVYFDSSTIVATEMTVEPGKITFMGDMVVKVSVGMGGADEAQNHFGDLIGRGNAFVVKYAPSQDLAHAMANPTTSTAHPTTKDEMRRLVRERARASWHFDVYVGVEHMTRAGSMDGLRRDPEHERAFWKMATKKVFAHEPDWQKLAQQRLDALN